MPNKRGINENITWIDMFIMARRKSGANMHVFIQFFFWELSKFTTGFDLKEKGARATNRPQNQSERAFPSTTLQRQSRQFRRAAAAAAAARPHLPLWSRSNTKPVCPHWQRRRQCQSCLVLARNRTRIWCTNRAEVFR